MTNAQIQSEVAGPLGWILGPDFFYNADTGTLSPNQVNQIKAQTAAAITQAATDPNTGQVNQSLADLQIAEANNQIDQAIAQAQAQSTGSTLADLADTVQGTGPSLSSFLANLFGSGPSSNAAVSVLNVIGDVILIVGAVIGIYFGYQFVKEL